MTLIGGILIGFAIGYFIGGALMREQIKAQLCTSVSRSAWKEVFNVLCRGAE